jgi:ribose transport system permease protein/erythritol transport system permease protein
MERTSTDTGGNRQGGRIIMTIASSEIESRAALWWKTRWITSLARFVAILVVFSFFALAVEGGRFYSPRNLESIARQSAVYATAAIGMTLIIIAAGIDLSVGSIIALTSVVVAWVLSRSTGVAPNTHFLIHEWPNLLPLAAVCGGILAATLAGALNGVLIVGLRLVPFIVTLGTLLVFRAAAKGIAEEKAIYPPEDSWLSHTMQPTFVPFLDWLRGASVAGLSEAGHKPSGMGWLVLPLGIWILIFAAICAAVLLRYTRFGRHVYAIGSNESTARLCGVPVERTKVLVYMLGGLFAGLAGLMQFSYEGGYGFPTTAVGYELQIIAAVVIGGGSLRGGEGSIVGSLIGALIITILYMGGQQMGWPKWVQEMVIGGIIIAAVALDRLRHRAAS